eukprot:547348-Karenia_brevis.AAC.1
MGLARAIKISASDGQAWAYTGVMAMSVMFLCLFPVTAKPTSVQNCMRYCTYWKTTLDQLIYTLTV